MLFNSLPYALFLPIVFILYWFITNKNLKVQNIFLMLCSYYFYSCWDWRFLFLLVFSTFLDYFTGLKISDTKSPLNRKMWLVISVTINLGFLVVFKYYNFFADSFAELLKAFGFHPDFVTLQVILPVGISFYTFHGLSYVFDIYNNKIKASTSYVNYSLFVSFFPLLVAGPIERATHLLPQVEKPRTFNYLKAVDGLRQILWGLFCKVVIADDCAEYANMIFNNSTQYSGSTLFLGALFFTFQIYGDFSGYSNIALGTARLLGFELLQNFSFPYFSRNIAEFWRRWHISLSSWFRDYIYIPLGGSKGNTWQKIRNVFIIFLVSGFWHGANWTFIFWGFINACLIIPTMLSKSSENSMGIVAKGHLLPSVKDAFRILATFTLTVFVWIFFRANSMTHAYSYISGIFSSTFFTEPEVTSNSKRAFFMIIIFVLIEWFGREDKYALEKLGFNWSKPVRWLFYCCIAFSVLYMAGNEQQFIYFQF